MYVCMSRSFCYARIYEVSEARKTEGTWNVTTPGECDHSKVCDQTMASDLAMDLRNKIKVLCAHAWLEPRCSKRYLLSRANSGAALETWSKIVDRLSVHVHRDHEVIEVEKMVS